MLTASLFVRLVRWYERARLLFSLIVEQKSWRPRLDISQFFQDITPTVLVAIKVD